MYRPSRRIPVAVTLPCLSSAQQELLKWVAIVSMLIDHANRSLWPYQIELFYVGRLAFPIFCFLIAYNTAVRRVPTKKYLLPLLGFALLSQAPFQIFFGYDIVKLNILFTLLLGVLIQPTYQWVATRLPEGYALKPLAFVAAGVLLLPAFFVSYGPAGVLLIPVLQLFLRRPTLLSLSLAILFVLLTNDLYLYSLIPLLLFPGILLLSRLDLNVGRGNKWVFYVFYPGHLSVLEFMRYIKNIA